MAYTVFVRMTGPPWYTRSLVSAGAAGRAVATSGGTMPEISGAEKALREAVSVRASAPAGSTIAATATATHSAALNGLNALQRTLITGPQARRRFPRSRAP